MRHALVLLFALLLPVSAFAADGGSDRADLIDLTRLLPPPPAAGSVTARDDLAAALAVQAARSTAESAAARADSAKSVFRFADVLGPAFQPAALPRTAAFFARLMHYDKQAVGAIKAYWHRPRPHVVSDRVQPLGVERPDDWSYPSGHATFGYSTAVLLANMLPEKRAAIFARADRYARHRVVMGVHFPTDVEAGRLAGTAIAARLLDDPAWRDDYAAARDELRKALALPAATDMESDVATGVR